MKVKMIVAISLIVVGLSFLGIFAITSKSASLEAVPVSSPIQHIQPRSIQIPEGLTTVAPDATAPAPTTEPAPAPAPVPAPVTPEPWYVVVAASVKEIAAAMVALAGAIMALVEVLKKLKEPKTPSTAG